MQLLYNVVHKNWYIFLLLGKEFSIITHNKYETRTDHCISLQWKRKYRKQDKLKEESRGLSERKKKKNSYWYATEYLRWFFDIRFCLQLHGYAGNTVLTTSMYLRHLCERTVFRTFRMAYAVFILIFASNSSYTSTIPTVQKDKILLANFCSLTFTFYGLFHIIFHSMLKQYLCYFSSLYSPVRWSRG
jgi:hypothetical protein